MDNWLVETGVEAIGQDLIYLVGDNGLAFSDGLAMIAEYKEVSEEEFIAGMKAWHPVNHN